MTRSGCLSSPILLHIIVKGLPMNASRISTRKRNNINIRRNYRYDCLTRKSKAPIY